MTYRSHLTRHGSLGMFAVAISSFSVVNDKEFFKMPLYRYECKKCGHEFRVLQQRSDDAVKCPSCESEDLHRLPSRVSVQFKGSGYYKTDRANKKSKAGTKGLSDKDTSEASSNGSSGETKNTASTPDSKPGKTGDSSTSSKKEQGN